MYEKPCGSSRWSGGNQRDIDRQRAMNRRKKAGVDKDKKDDGLTPQQRKERDAERLKQKIAAKEKMKEEQQSK